MIVRTWRGATTAADGDAYVEYLTRTGLAAYRATPGNRGAYALRRIVPEPDGTARAEFLLLSLWNDMNDVHAFAGADVSRAVFYPDDERFLIERDEHVDHYDLVFADGDGWAPSQSDSRGQVR